MDAPDTPDVKSGIYTSEFWHTVIAQVISVAVLFGFITPNDSGTLEESASKCVTAIFMLIGNALIVIYYIRSRLHAKGLVPASVAITSPPDMASAPPTLGKSVLPLFVATALGLWAVGSAVQAAPPASVVKTALLPWRSGVERRLQALEAQGRQPQAPAPQAPIIIQAPAPLPAIPAPAAPQIASPGLQPGLQIYQIPPSPILLHPVQPQQILPIAGPIQQSLPIQGAPQQFLNPQGQPQQLLNPQGAPQGPPLPVAPPQGIQQQLPIQQAQPGPAPAAPIPAPVAPAPMPAPIPRQMLPIAPTPVVPQPGVPQAPQQLSGQRVWALWR